MKGEIILWAVASIAVTRFNYRELQEILTERGFVTRLRSIAGVQCYAPEIEKRLRWVWCHPGRSH